jgi:hypothetical protein
MFKNVLKVNKDQNVILNLKMFLFLSIKLEDDLNQYNILFLKKIQSY